jgi:hypothetical protein
MLSTTASKAALKAGASMVAGATWIPLPPFRPGALSGMRLSIVMAVAVLLGWDQHQNDH